MNLVYPNSVTGDKSRLRKVDILLFTFRTKLHSYMFRSFPMLRKNIVSLDFRFRATYLFWGKICPQYPHLSMSCTVACAAVMCTGKSGYIPQREKGSFSCMMMTGFVP